MKHILIRITEDIVIIQVGILQAFGRLTFLPLTIWRSHYSYLNATQFPLKQLSLGHQKIISGERCHYSFNGYIKLAKIGESLRKIWPSWEPTTIKVEGGR